jgi:VWFA-related protein
LPDSSDWPAEEPEGDLMTLLATFVAAPVLLLACLPAAARQAPAKPAGKAGAGSPQFTVRSDLVFLPTRVQSKDGKTIYGLKPDDFLVEDNGVRQSVEVDEGPDSLGVSLVVAVECSRSAPSEFDKLKGLGAMIEAIVGDAPHEVAILAYGDGPRVLGDFTGSSQAVRLAVSRLKPCGDYHAATIDAVQFAIGMLNRHRARYRRAILLISETRDHGSRAKLEDVVAELGVTDTVIYSAAFSPGRDELLQGFRNDPNPPPAAAPPWWAKPAGEDPNSSLPAAAEPTYVEKPPLLELPPQLMLIVNALRRNSASEMASLSGGEYMNFTTRKGFDAGLQRISNQIHNYYLLSFKPPWSPAFGPHSLRVRVAGYPDAAIQTRRSYWSGILESSTGGARQ